MVLSVIIFGSAANLYVIIFGSTTIFSVVKLAFAKSRSPKADTPDETDWV